MERRFHEIASGRARGPGAAALRFLLWLCSWVFEAGARLRSFGYDRGWLTIHRASVPVISVGNLTTGGTGKTPLVAFLATELIARGLCPAILSRGYGAVAGEANDEVSMLARQIPGARFVTGPDRVTSAAVAAKNGADVILLDDGFQHRRLARDLDIVVVDATRPFGYDALLPRGLLREPLCALARAQIVFISRCNLVPEPRLLEIEEQLRRSGAKRITRGRLAAGWLRLLAGDQRQETTWLDGQRIVAACGIGNPQAFKAGLTLLGAEVCELRAFPDHYEYQAADLQELQTLAKQQPVIVTAKDEGKLASLADGSVPGLWVYDVELAPDEPELLRSLLDGLKA